jgi:asparagine synthase (glutamine-hydrolysing)
VSRLASRSVKVALSGDGGDEAFGGYAHYAHELKEGAVRRRVPAWLRGAPMKKAAAAWPKADWLPRPLRLKMLLTNLSLEPADAFASTVALCRAPARRQVLATGIVAHLNGHDPERAIRDSYLTARADDPLAGMTAAQIATFLPDDFLVKVDRASMAHGLEVRPPFLDHELMELAARIPSEYKIRRGVTKWILKETYRQRLSADLLSRPKQGFEVPIDAWLRGPLRDMFHDVVLEARGPIAGLVDASTVGALYRSHAAGTGRHGNVLWAVMVLARWAERYLETPAAC